MILESFSIQIESKFEVFELNSKFSYSFVNAKLHLQIENIAK